MHYKKNMVKNHMFYIIWKLTFLFLNLFNLGKSHKIVGILALTCDRENKNVLLNELFNPTWAKTNWI